jgi:hypothetical protein
MGPTFTKNLSSEVPREILELSQVGGDPLGGTRDRPPRQTKRSIPSPNLQ